MFDTEIKSLKSLNYYLRKLVENRLWLKVIIALFLGVGVGLLLSPQNGWITKSTAYDFLKPVKLLLGAIQEICMTVVKWAMLLVPIAVFGLMAQLTSSVGLNSLAGLGFYVLVVLIGLLILVGIYLVLVSILGRSNPFKFLRKITDVQLLAFSTTSSAAVMPLSLKTAEEELKVDASISNFIIPIGTTVNMDGTALYQTITTLFIAQAYGLEMGFLNVIVIIVTIVAASIGTPAIPGRRRRDFGFRAIQCRNSGRRNYYNHRGRAFAWHVPFCGQRYWRPNGLHGIR